MKKVVIFEDKGMEFIRQNVNKSLDTDIVIARKNYYD